ncbi:acetyltransferase (GNAT) family protein [Sinobacterium caligoides]|uniref:Acetyltransferase (GNAT) family protein n=1 Tax=Sinobacterium caligoides TaxID=933926 RepID=A0A3N2E0V2_9GAMM|nr:GNAT family N-acetyltransferase [Sinobacterium caligoides]ROS05532.1 acetyltransferase (GNAT) family protein [Sinobacterium caligoides]
MSYIISQSSEKECRLLAELRVVAMQESLEALGRFDPVRARERFLSGFDAATTWTVKVEQELIGFYTYEPKIDHIWIGHLYIHPNYQSTGLGGKLLTELMLRAKQAGFPIRLGALKGSRSNEFYIKHGFKLTHEEEWDNYYEYKNC